MLVIDGNLFKKTNLMNEPMKYLAGMEDGRVNKNTLKS
jgi:hypothetical protein